MQWMLMPLRRYADFQGRSRRKEFWMWMLLQTIVGVILGIILAVMVAGAANRAAVSGYDDGPGRYESPSDSGLDDERGSDSRGDDEGSGDEGGKPSGDESSAVDQAPEGYLSYSYSSSYSSSSTRANEALMRELGAGFWIVFGLIGLWGLVTFIPNLAVIIRRLHDIDKSGWNYFLGLIPIVGFIILLIYYCTEGTRGPNRFGPDPKGGLPGGY